MDGAQRVCLSSILSQALMSPNGEKRPIPSNKPELYHGQQERIATRYRLAELFA
ncbi:MAG: hypothetical protein ACI97K_001264 [Glaciecola sp.]|jgi:hypothetical protein